MPISDLPPPPSSETRRVDERRHLDFAPDHEAPLPPRPRTRGECVDGPRPCPWVGCRHHLALDVNYVFDGAKRVPGETLRIHALLDPRDPDLEVLAETCSLDVADATPAATDESSLLALEAVAD